nr:PepSY domain-containing protein [uncultured Cohaesibacter sp.]
MSLAAITQTANAVVEGEVVKANLCSSNGRLVYEVVVLSRQGNVSRLILDAKSGKTISVNE